MWDVPDGEEALRLLDILTFDLVITDVYMSAMDGMELLVRAQAARAPRPRSGDVGRWLRPARGAARHGPGVRRLRHDPQALLSARLRDTVSAVLRPRGLGQRRGVEQLADPARERLYRPRLLDAPAAPWNGRDAPASAA